MKFTPPRVNYKRPKVETFLAFLHSKGWVVKEKWGGYHLMKAPAEFKVEGGGDFEYLLPTATDSLSHDELAFDAVEVFSELYGIPLQELFDLLSQSLDDIRQEVKEQPARLKMRRAMLASAS